MPAAAPPLQSIHTHKVYWAAAEGGTRFVYIYKSCERRVRRQQVFTIDQAPVLMLLAHLFCIYNPGRAAFHPTRKTTSFLQGVVSLFIFTLCWTRVLPNLKVIRRKYKSSRGVFGKGGRFGNLNRRFPLICDCYYLTSRDFSPPNCV